MLKTWSPYWRNWVRQLKCQGPESKVRTMVVIVPAKGGNPQSESTRVSFQKVLFALLVITLSNNCLVLSVLDQIGLHTHKKSVLPQEGTVGEGTFLFKQSLSLVPNGSEGWLFFVAPRSGLPSSCWVGYTVLAGALTLFLGDCCWVSHGKGLWETFCLSTGGSSVSKIFKRQGKNVSMRIERRKRVKPE